MLMEKKHNCTGARAYSTIRGEGTDKVSLLSTALVVLVMFSCAKGSLEHRRLLNATPEIAATCSGK